MFHISLIACKGDKEDIRKTYKLFEREEEVKENNMEDQFRGVDFG